MAAVTYTVVKGDTLTAIAKKHGTTVDAIAKLNNIKNVNLIYVGQVLTISGQSSSSVVSGGGTSSPSYDTTVTYSSSTGANNATVTAIGLQADTTSTIFATWTWTRSNTKEYEVEWDYYTADGKWFTGSHSKIEQSNIKASTYNAPDNAEVVRFRVKPVSTTYTKDDKEISHWTASWTSYSKYDVSQLNMPTAPTPSLTVTDYTLTCRVDNVTGYNERKGQVYIQFEVMKNDTACVYSGLAKLIFNGASYSCNIDTGHMYKARARIKQGDVFGEWSAFSGNVNAKPTAPSGIISCKAASETSVFLSWNKVESAKTYQIEYAVNKDYFDGSNATTKIDGIESTQYTITGLGSGERYYFRVRSANEQGESGWTGIASVILGTKPTAPTTWSSTSTVVAGEDLILYWVHNSEDESNETIAEVEVYYGDRKITHTVVNSNESEEIKTSQYVVSTATYPEGTVIKWRVRTAGITREFGDWSTQRTVDVYAPATLELSVIDKDNNPLDILTSFPFHIQAMGGPDTQKTISYSVSIVALSNYETIDEAGNTKVVSAGDEVYRSYHDVDGSIAIKMEPNNIDLQNGIEYQVNCMVAMDSGLTAEAMHTFSVSWVDEVFVPNAEIAYDNTQYVTHIHPTCDHYPYIFYEVDYVNEQYVRSKNVIDEIEGISVDNAMTTRGDIVYAGYLNNILTHFCIVQSTTPVAVPGITLSVYRRDFDGKFIEIASGLKNEDNTFVTDPHPNLNMVKYRIIAVSDNTGSISYVDLPAYFIDEKAIILQWNESWNGVEISDDGSIIDTAWTGSRLRLPYNIDVSENTSVDISLVEYIGREYPVSYYGTQVGTTATWSVEIPRSDVDTLASLRRLAVWMGDVYVREPSGTGYWANVNVSFSQTHKELTIPVTLSITRVAGGI